MCWVGFRYLVMGLSHAYWMKQVLGGRVHGGHRYTRAIHIDASGPSLSTGTSTEPDTHGRGQPAGFYTDPRGPDATREMLRFFLEHSLPAAAM